MVVRAKQGLSSDESTELRNDLTDISRTTHGLYLAGILEMRAAAEISSSLSCTPFWLLSLLWY